MSSSKFETKIINSKNIQRTILNYLSNEDLISLAQVNTTMNNIVIESNKLILNQLSSSENS